MASDTWYSVAVPILEAIAESEASGTGLAVRIQDLADHTGLTSQQVFQEVDRLIAGGYVIGNLKQMWGGGDVGPSNIYNCRLGPEGARAVGLWPSTDPYEALVAILERRVEDAPDESSRSKWRKVLETLKGLGRDVGTNAIANVLVEGGKAGT